MESNAEAEGLPLLIVAAAAAAYQHRRCYQEVENVGLAAVEQTALECCPCWDSSVEMVEAGLAEVVVVVVVAAVAAAAAAAFLLGCHWKVQTDRLRALDHHYRLFPCPRFQGLRRCHQLHRRVHLIAVAA